MVSEKEIQRIVKKAKTKTPITKKEFETYLDSLSKRTLRRGLELAIKRGIFK